MFQERIQRSVFFETVSIPFTLIDHFPGLFATEHDFEAVKVKVCLCIYTDLDVRDFISGNGELLNDRMIPLQHHDVFHLHILAAVVKEDCFALQNAHRTDRHRKHKRRYAKEKRRADLPYQTSGNDTAFLLMITRMSKDNIKQKHDPHRCTEKFLVMKSVNIPHTHGKVPVLKNIFQDSAIQNSLIYHTLAAENIHRQHKDVCDHQKQISILIHKDIQYEERSHQKHPLRIPCRKSKHRKAHCHTEKDCPGSQSFFFLHFFLISPDQYKGGNCCHQIDPTEKSHCKRLFDIFKGTEAKHISSECF